MFNQKVNGYLSQNPEYLNNSYSAPSVRPYDVHKCGTTISKYNKSSKCSNLPLQTWCSANAAVESFAMRPIFNPSEYFASINKYLSSIVYTDSINLKNSGLTNEHYYLYTDYGQEPRSSLIQDLKIEVTDKLNYYMSISPDNVSIFKDYNPICEGFVITDIDITTYASKENNNHFFHEVLFSAFNTTRYNTISFKAGVYQDISQVVDGYNNLLNDVINSKASPKNIDFNTNMYISLITLLNNTTCVTGQEDECSLKGYNIKSNFSQLLNDNFLDKKLDLTWKQPGVITQNNYNNSGNYDSEGNISVTDYGPENLDELIKRIQ